MPTRGTGVGNPKYYKCLASRFYGGTDFVGAAREAQQAVRIVRDVQGEHSSISFYEIPFAIASANGGGHVSYLLTLCGGEIGLKTLSTSQPWGSWSCSSAYNHLREDSVICSRAPPITKSGLPLIASTHTQESMPYYNRVYSCTALLAWVQL
mmetsp:Transcript_25911/g.78057  ORF Transcript_25911/g.78057 Transcript_25911/m.78057 type:complete len:152 (-) Transcript_25911:839-1294(-)